MNQDFKKFNEKVSWFNHKNEFIEVTDDVDLDLTKEFEKTFPSLFYLVSISRKHSIKFKGSKFILYAWDMPSGDICGWLCEIENNQIKKKNILPEHRLILQNIGGIKEYFSGPDSTELDGINYNRALTANQNFMFIESHCENGVGDYQNYYEDRCKEDNCNRMETDDFLVFAVEGNGDKTLYHRITTKVLLLLHDHDFNFVEPIEGQPESTFYRIKGVSTFFDYIDILAKQWIKHVQKS